MYEAVAYNISGGIYMQYFVTAVDGSMSHNVVNTYLRRAFWKLDRVDQIGMTKDAFANTMKSD
jgi:hypothetical protein